RAAIVVEADHEEHETRVAIASIELREMRVARSALAAPRRREGEHHDVALLLGQPYVAARDALQNEVRGIRPGHRVGGFETRRSQGRENNRKLRKAKVHASIPSSAADAVPKKVSDTFFRRALPRRGRIRAPAPTRPSDHTSAAAARSLSQVSVHEALPRRLLAEPGRSPPNTRCRRRQRQTVGMRRRIETPTLP